MYVLFNIYQVSQVNPMELDESKSGNEDLHSSASGTSKNLVADEKIQELLKKQVLLPCLEKSGGVVTHVLPPMHSNLQSENVKTDQKSEQVNLGISIKVRKFQNKNLVS